MSVRPDGYMPTALTRQYSHSFQTLELLDYRQSRNTAPKA